MVQLQAESKNLTHILSAELEVLNQGLQVDLSSGIIYAFSPIAKIETIENGNFLITITDKEGTTVAEVPNLTDEKINQAIQMYIESHPIIQEHDQDEMAHEYIRNLISDAIDQIPTRTSQLQNDSGYVSNFKQLMVFYNSFSEFPNIPPQEQRDMVFVDKSTGDMYVFGVNNSIVYSPFGIANNDTIYGGDSTQR